MQIELSGRDLSRAGRKIGIQHSKSRTPLDVGFGLTDKSGAETMECASRRFGCPRIFAESAENVEVVIQADAEFVNSCVA